MEFKYLKIVEEPVNIDFDKIVDYIKKENSGEFVDSFSDNIDVYLDEIFGIKLIDYEFDFDDVNYYNSQVTNWIFDEWQNYLEEKGLLKW